MMQLSIHIQSMNITQKQIDRAINAINAGIITRDELKPELAEAVERF